MQIPERIWNAVNKTDSCWNWTHGKLAGGYGQVVLSKKKWTSHRLFYSAFVGPIPEGMLVCHKCDNPSCVNPEHLFLGTHLDNNRDCYAKGRMPLRYGHLATNVAKLTETQAKHIKYSDLASKELVALYGVNQSQISRIRSGKTWKNI